MSQSIESLQLEIIELKKQLEDKEKQLQVLLEKNIKQSPTWNNNGLTNEEIARYSRQIILPDFGVTSQIKLKNSSVLIVGAGGLGCPSSLHLVGAGIGRLGIVDYDDVEVTNLHRQLLHRQDSIGMSKVDSAKQALKSLNSNVEIQPYRVQLNMKNALEIIKDYDVILDCTDNVATRYLLNDACVLLKKPLVSGSALQYDGQLTVYNYGDGPCYRCLFPQPPPPEAVTNCGDGGIFATVTGVIGTLQAMEAVKILLQHSSVLSKRLLIYNGLETTFRDFKLRGKKTNCEVCSENPTLTTLIDYEQFCGMKATDKDSHLNILDRENRFSVDEYNDLKNDKYEHCLIDVRSINEYEICNLPGSINIPIKTILDTKKTEELITTLSDKRNLVVICRRGNDSQLAVQKIKPLLPSTATVKDVIGGLHAWTKKIDPNFPIY